MSGLGGLGGPWRGRLLVSSYFNAREWREIDSMKDEASMNATAWQVLKPIRIT